MGKSLRGAHGGVRHLAVAASRLERLAKERGAQPIVSEAVFAALAETAGTATPLDGVTLKGYAEPLLAWRIA